MPVIFAHPLMMIMQKHFHITLEQIPRPLSYLLIKIFLGTMAGLLSISRATMPNALNSEPEDNIPV
jgi:hypothetical protein